MKNHLLFILVSLLLIPSCKNQPSSDIAIPSMKESLTSEKQREQIQDRLTKVLNKSTSTPEEIIAAAQPYLGVLYEYATDDDVSKRLYSQLGATTLMAELHRKNDEMQSKGIVEDENWLHEVYEDLFKIDNLWRIEINDNNTIILTHHRLFTWDSEGNPYATITVKCPEEGEPIVSINFPAEALGAPSASFSDYVNGKEDLDNQVHYDLPTWNDKDAFHKNQRLTEAGKEFLDLMLNNTFMYLFYRTNSQRSKEYEGVEMVKIPLETFQIAYRDAMIR